jgi:PiT family inorganic phosphate transporter
MGQGFTHLTPQQGFAAQIASSAVILTSSHMGLPLSTTHVATGSIVGVGAATPNQPVRWRLAADVAMAWVITLPAAGLFGAFSYYVAHLIGGTFGVVVLALVAGAYVAFLMKRSRRHAVNSTNVNDLWGDPVAPLDASAVVAA